MSALVHLACLLGAFSALLTDDYIHTNGGTGGVLDKERWLEYIRTRHSELGS